MKMVGDKKVIGGPKKVVGGQNFGKKVIGGVKIYPTSTSLNGIALRKIILGVSWKLKDNQKYI